MVRLVPSFPPYEGPHQVGTVEVEIPVSSLMDGLREDEGIRVKFEQKERTIHTILFRIYYPATGAHPHENVEGKPHEKGWGDYLHGLIGCGKRKPVYWVPEPYQNEFLKAYLRFGGLSKEWLVNWIGGRASLLPHFLNNITIPAIANSPLEKQPSTTSHFPTMIFSHGLGGSRLAYSHICSNLASYGVVVFAPEHRDGSGPVSIIRKKNANGEKEFTTESVPYVNIPHNLTEEMSEGRDYQLSTRLTELSLLYKAVQSINAGIIPKGTIFGPEGEEVDKDDSQLSMFRDKLDVKTPGRVIWAGHSFGAATMVQFIKSIYYMGSEEWKTQAQLFTLKEHEAAELRSQITKKSPLLLLDLWSLSLLGSKRTYWLWKKPLPQVIPLDTGEKDGEDACRLLTIMSQQFYTWKENMWAVKWVLSRNPGLRDGAVREIFDYDPITGKEIDTLTSSTTASESATSAHEGEVTGENNDGYRPPKLYYIKQSAHLSQSDFNLLFPIMFRKAAPDPQKVLGLNIRAAVQWLREAGFRQGLAPYGQVEGQSGDDEIFGCAEVEEGVEVKGEKKGEKKVLEGWVRLGLHEEKIKKKAVKEAVREGMGAGGEADLEAEGDLEEGRERSNKI